MGGGGVSQVKAALSAIGRYRGVSQLYCRKSRFKLTLSPLLGGSSLGGPLGACSYTQEPFDFKIGHSAIDFSRHAGTCVGTFATIADPMNQRES